MGGSPLALEFDVAAKRLVKGANHFRSFGYLLIVNRSDELSIFTELQVRAAAADIVLS
jgi:hypothetical protein